MDSQQHDGDGSSAVICPCHLHDLQRVLDQPVCSMLYIIARLDSQFLCTHVYFFFGDHT